MAVVQISRIQLRRGKINSGTGLPQLASGELAWAIDTQELYIGNGSVAEGAPAVGNTKVLTLNDLTTQGNILSLVTYIYRSSDTTITTGSDANNPTTRLLQEKLDDTANVKDFGVLGLVPPGSLADDYIPFQRAIDQLFLNDAGFASNDTDEASLLRRTLYIPAGTYLITDTLYIPSYTTIVGAGADKTIIKYSPTTSGVSPAIRFVNDNSSIGNPSDISSTTYNNQPRNISISGLTVITTSGDDTAMQLDCVRDSEFKDVTLRGEWDLNYNVNSVGLEMRAFSNIVTTENNLFENIKIYNFNFAVNAKYDILHNRFVNGNVENCYQGFKLGDNADGTTPGEQFGPRDTLINNIKFENIKRHAVYLELGSGNATKECVYVNVGCNGSTNVDATYPQLFYAVPGNSSLGDKTDRHTDLAAANLTTLYSPEFAGHGDYQPANHNKLSIGYIIASSPILGFRLFCNSNMGGVPEGTISYKIQYVYRSTTHNFSRSGTITVAADIDRAKIQLSDDYDVACDPAVVPPASQVLLDFQAYFLDELGVKYTGAPGQIPASIGIYYKNDYSADAGWMYYSYSAHL